MKKGLMTRTALIAFACSLALYGHARADDLKRDINVPAGDLSTALQILARQSGVEFVSQASQLEGQRTRGVSGALTAQEAVTKLLEGTSLTLRIIDGAMLISPQREPAADKQNVQEPAQRPDSTASIGLDEVLVTGTRLTTAQPDGTVQVFDREKIDSLGVKNVAEVLSYLPQQSFTVSEAFRSGGQSYAQLRGLPLGGTLVLINGRRPGLTGQDISFRSFDVNMIPLAAIERIEVLNDTASAVYGADAVAGVVNITTKKSIDRPTLDLRYASADGDAPEWRGSFAMGHEGERFRGIALVDYLRREPLWGSERSRLANQDYRRFGSLDRRVANAAPAAILSTNGANLPGLSSPFALLRPGADGTNLARADFISVPNATALQTESLLSYTSIVRDVEQYSGATFLEYDVSDRVTAFAEVLYTDSRVHNQLPTTASLTVPAGNPFNPFGVSVSSRYLFKDLASQEIETEQLISAAGARGGIGTWDWEMFLQRSRSPSSFDRTSVDVAQANCLLTNPSTRSAGACKGINEALNVFDATSAGSDALVASLLAPTTFSPQDATTWQAQGFLRGKVLQLPAGALEVVLGAAWTDERIDFASPIDSTAVLSPDRTTSALFAEMEVPLIGPAMNIPGLHRLSARLAGRYDRYSDFGNELSPKFSLLWSPMARLSFSASYGESFTPPGIYDLTVPARALGPTTLLDPLRNNEPVSVDRWFGGNPGLRPERGESLTAGFNWEPAFVEGLELSARYWWIELKDRIAALSDTTIVRFPELFGAQIVRAAPTPADIAAGRPGQLVSVNISPVNYAGIETDGVDLSARYSLETTWGRFSPSVSATWTDRFESDDAPGTPVVERVGLVSPGIDGTIPEWRGVASLSWARNALSGAVTARYIDGVADTFSSARNGRQLPAQTLVDVQFSADAGSLKVSVGARNLFDKMPPFTEATNHGYDVSQGNLIGRTVYATLSKGF